ncbi:GntR family transcriptional regulator [Acidipila rosea]|uniref:GntR family transcriptional regulator n=1 Tax=Acidipila rosea TaxID=768535 RepID=A0A4R1LCH4_9BACT|nr:GntR family transcriptional regulator [Acidipila rosea]MBW4027255.1 GntR family transcriptional regulator [Acidobacteriota bacterium]MBW4046157.1 GntR family transcriptional regulator [Acidobacteriota bacterium]TCK74239.1 GntR family transcriptional regulator [Acidipila rosea]
MQYKKRAEAKAPAKTQNGTGVRSLQLSPLNKTSFTPLYIQIQSEIFANIRNGKLKPGDPLPSEEDLCEAFSVSRMTVRQAIRELKDQGYASSQKGRGTFVTEPKVERDAAQLRGFADSMRALGLIPGSRVLRQDVVPATGEFATRLQVAPGTPLVRIERLRTANDHPIGVEESLLLQSEFPGLEKINFSKQSLFEVLSTSFGVRLGSATEVIEALPATIRQAKLLDVPARSSLLVITRNLMSVEGRPIEAARSFYRGDRYRAVLQVRSEADVKNVGAPEAWRR